MGDVGRRVVTDQNDASRDQWIGWIQAAMLLRAREVTKVCAFMPYRGDFRSNMPSRLDLSNSQIEFVPTSGSRTAVNCLASNGEGHSCIQGAGVTTFGTRMTPRTQTSRGGSGSTRTSRHGYSCSRT